MKTILIFFSEKFFVWGNWTILGPKMVHPHNSGSVVRIFLKFCSMKRAISEMKVTIIVCTKKKFSGQMGHLVPKMAYLHNSESALRIF